MDKNEMTGLIAVVAVVFVLLVAGLAIVHAIMSLIPILVVGGIVGGLLYFKYKN